MATKIKRCLFVGLGGTGLTTLLHTKRMLIDTYGEVPPMIGFLGIDTDGNAYTKSLPSKYGEVTLAPNEQVKIQVTDPSGIYLNYRDRFSWIHDNNVAALTSMTAGAGMVRTNGRFAFGINYPDVEARVKQALNAITNIRIAQNAKYTLLDNAVEISMVFSIAGGTGCGTFIDMAYLLKAIQQTNKKSAGKLIGYAVLPDVFDAQLTYNKDRLKPNGFGALCDCDYLMHLGIGDKFTFDYVRETVEVDGKPFNAVYFAGNKNFNNTSYDHVDDIAEMISRSLVTGAGELSGSASSVADNAEKDMISCTYDIEDKKAWASALGMSEMIFRSGDLSRIYELKASRRIIERLLNSCGDSEIVANAWIDSPEVRIRENNGRDDIIDFMLPQKPEYPMNELDDPSDPRPQIADYRSRVALPSSHVPNRLGELTDRVEREFHKLMVDTINQECGIGLAKQVIAAIRGQVEICMGEMQQELKAFRHNQGAAESALEVSIKDLLEIIGKIFTRKGAKQEAKDDVVEHVNNVVINEREIERREAAISFYTWMLNLLKSADSKIDTIKSVFENIHRIDSAELTVLQDGIRRRTQIFQIDLTLPYVNRVVVDDGEIDPAQFIASVPWTDKLLDIPGRPQSELAECLHRFASQLHGAVQWRNRDIEGALRELPEDELYRKYRFALEQSSPLINLDFKGRMHRAIPDYYFIGVPDKEHTYLREGPIDFKTIIDGNVDCNYASIGGTDRIVIFRQYGVFPPYAISSVNDYRHEYNEWNSGMTSYSCHFDENIRRRMVRDDYSLDPKERIDNTLELWVKGLIFGLIKNDEGRYFYKDEENGDALDDYWSELEPYRDEAFTKFQRLKPSIEEAFTRYLEELERVKGTAAVQQTIDAAKENYLTDFAQVNMTTEELKKRENRSIADLIRREINFVKKEL